MPQEREEKNTINPNFKKDFLWAMGEDHLQVDPPKNQLRVFLSPGQQESPNQSQPSAQPPAKETSG